MIRILVDSAADYHLEELQARNIELVPLRITVDDTDTYRDELDLTRGELYKLMIEDGRSVKTSQPSPQEFVEKFSQAKEAGDDLICILLSSALSGTCQSAALAKSIVDYDRIHIVDSLSATFGIKILANHARNLADAGKSAEEIVSILEDVKGRIKIIAAVDTLKYLYLGGRVSKTTAIVADAANIKPAIYVSHAGEVGVGSKYLGVSRAVRDLVKQMKATDIDTSFPVYTLYSYNNENCLRLTKALEDAGIKVSESGEIGSTLGVHVGPGAFGIICITK